MEKIKIGGTYRHYKNKLYRVLNIGKHSETLEEMVVYQALYDSKEFGPNSIWIRPKKMFEEDVEIDEKLIPRFKLIENERTGGIN